METNNLNPSTIEPTPTVDVEMSTIDHHILKDSHKNANTTGGICIAFFIFFLIMFISSFLVTPTQYGSFDPVAAIFFWLSLVASLILLILRLVYGLMTGIKLMKLEGLEKRVSYIGLAVLMIVFTIVSSIGAIAVAYIIRNKIAKKDTAALKW